MPYLRKRRYWRFALAVLCVLSASIWVDAQRRPPLGTPTGFDDVVFAISFSPDGRTLAIARGADEPSQRFGRIELWDTESGKLRHVIKGFDGPVRSLSFTPDGQTLVSASSEFRTSKVQQKARSRDGEVFGELKWWDAQTGELKHQFTLPGEGNSSIDLAYSPDDKQLAVVELFTQYSYLSTSVPFDVRTPTLNPPFPAPYVRPSMFITADMKLLDAQTGEQKFKLNTTRPGRAVFSPDGELLALADGAEVKLWNARTGKEERKLKDFKGRPGAIAFSSDGQLLAVASTKYDSPYSRHFFIRQGNSEVKLFDVHTWKATLKLQNLGVVNCLAFSPGGRVLVIGGLLWEKNNAVPAVKLWDLQTGKTVDVANAGGTFTEAVNLLAIARTGDLLAFRSGSGTVKLLDTKTWQVKQTMYTESVGDAVERPVSRFVLSVKRVLAVAFSPDGKTLSGETDQGEIKLWDPRTGEVKKQFTDDEDPSLVAVSGDGKTFAEISNAKLRVWEVGGGEKRIVPLPGGGSITAVALSANGQTLAIGSGQDIVVLTRTGEVVNTLTGHQSSVDRLSFSDDLRMLASADENGAVEIWDLAKARVGRTIATGARTTALRFAPNGLILAIANETHTISLWNLQSGLPQQKLQKHEAVINALAFSPDGQLLASGGDDRTVIIWDTSSGKSKRTLKGHDQTVTSVAFSPDGRLLASGSGNASVVLWDVKTGKLSRVLR
jgi:WD40 repeat protein